MLGAKKWDISMFLGVGLILLDGNIWNLIDAGRFWFIQGRYFVCWAAVKRWPNVCAVSAKMSDRVL